MTLVIYTKILPLLSSVLHNASINSIKAIMTGMHVQKNNKYNIPAATFLHKIYERQSLLAKGQGHNK